MIYLSEYNPEWPNLFAEAQKEIPDAFGQIAVEIVHIGSTAIPNICAKPVIDIMLGVRSLEDINSRIVEKLAHLGYVYMKKYEEGMPFRRFFQRDNAADVRTHHIHLVEIQSDFWKKHLLFRDYLRAHPEEAKRYERFKQEISKKFTDTNEYAHAKTEYCKEIHTKAARWNNAH